MKVIHTTFSNVTEKNYVIEVDGKTYFYKDYYNSKGKVIDSELSDEVGLITNQDLIEHIQNHIDNLEN